MSPAIDPAASYQLSSQRPPTETPAVVPRFNPGRSERRVVDQSDLGEPAQDRLSRVSRNSPSAERVGQLSSGTRSSRQQPQADQPRDRLGIRLVLTIAVPAKPSLGYASGSVDLPADTTGARTMTT